MHPTWASDLQQDAAADVTASGNCIVVVKGLRLERVAQVPVYIRFIFIIATMASGSPSTNETPSVQPSPVAAGQCDRRIFPLSPLIRITLLGLYVALTLPLPILYHWQATQLSAVAAGTGTIPVWVWIAGLTLGGLALFAALSERVEVDSHGIQVTYPRWVPRLLWRGWQLPWAEVQSLKPRSTGQGGLVYYFVSKGGQAYLLPMRVAGFAELVGRVQAATGIDTRDVRPLAQPWMYGLLLLLTLMLLGIDGWAIAAAWQ